jgi:ribosomal protein L9
MKMIDKDKAREAVREAEMAKERAALAERLAAVQVTVEARAGEDGHLYGSVGPRQVLDALKRLGFHFEERHVKFEGVRELGQYEVPIHLAKDQAVQIKLWVVQDAQEAQSQAEAKAEADAKSPGAGQPASAPATESPPAPAATPAAPAPAARAEGGKAKPPAKATAPEAGAGAGAKKPRS